MAASAIVLFEANLDDIRMRDLLTATVKLALVASSYTPSAAHSTFANVTGEIANGNGYTSGGAALANKAISSVTGGHKFASDNVVWNASGGNIPAWRYGVLYVEGSLWGMTNPLIGYFVGDATPADIPATLDGNPLTINTPAAGWFDITQ